MLGDGSKMPITIKSHKRTKTTESKKNNPKYNKWICGICKDLFHEVNMTHAIHMLSPSKNSEAKQEGDRNENISIYICLLSNNINKGLLLYDRVFVLSSTVQVYKQ